MQSTSSSKFTSLSHYFSLINMSTTLDHLLDHQLQEQICYVQCGFCTTVLLVCVPYRCLSMVVTVKCGYCTSILSVNMMSPSFVPLHLFSSADNLQEDSHMQPVVESDCKDQEVPKLTLSKHNYSPPLISSSSSSSVEDNQDDLEEVVNHVVNKPPGKKYRAPSAYNNFIKEEITRLKTQHPNMSHKQAFSTAAKNWAHATPSQETDEEEDKSKGSGGDSGEPTVLIQELGSDHLS